MRAIEPAGAGPGRLVWRTAEVVRIADETPRVRSLFLRLPEPLVDEAGEAVGTAGV